MFVNSVITIRKQPAHSTYAALLAGAASVAGAGMSGTLIGGTGALLAGAAVVAGAGTLGAIGTGALLAGASTVAGVGTLTIQGTGALLAGAATVAGAGSAGTLVSGAGALAAQSATVAGSGKSSSMGTGALAAGAATVVGSGTAVIATSYANAGGTGARSSVISVTSNKVQGGGLIGNLVDGDLSTGTTHSFFFNSGSTDNVIVFDFTPSGFKQVIDEFKWYQDNATSHGTWAWEGFDGSAWTTITSITLGGATTSTYTVTNSTPYIAYRLRQTASSASSSPFCKEAEFKIAQGPAWTATSTSYSNTGGTGNRTASITVNWDGTLGAGSGTLPLEPKFVDGSSASDLWWTGLQTGKTLKFDFGSGKIINELRWVQSNSSTHGIQSMEASNDGSTWTQISGFFQTSGGASGFGGGTSTTWPFTMNTGSWRYYRLRGPVAANAGSTSSSPFLFEAEFKIST